MRARREARQAAARTRVRRGGTGSMHRSGRTRPCEPTAPQPCDEWLPPSPRSAPSCSSPRAARARLSSFPAAQYRAAPMTSALTTPGRPVLCSRRGQRANEPSQAPSKPRTQRPNGSFGRAPTPHAALIHQAGRSGEVSTRAPRPHDQNPPHTFASSRRPLPIHWERHESSKVRTLALAHAATGTHALTRTSRLPAHAPCP